MHRNDFAAFVHTAASITDDMLLAWIDRDAASTALTRGQLPLSRVERRILTLAAGTPVTLRQAIPGPGATCTWSPPPSATPPDSTTNNPQQTSPAGPGHNPAGARRNPRRGLHVSAGIMFTVGLDLRFLRTQPTVSAASRGSAACRLRN